jgi:DNA-directed RNA polymerase beta subunit
MATTTNRGAKARIDFGKINKLFDYPNLLDIQVQSFQDFFN